MKKLSIMKTNIADFLLENQTFQSNLLQTKDLLQKMRGRSKLRHYRYDNAEAVQIAQYHAAFRIPRKNDWMFIGYWRRSYFKRESNEKSSCFNDGLLFFRAFYCLL